MLVNVSLKVFPVAVVTIFLNVAPVLTVFLSGLLIPSENLTKGIVLKALISFAGVLLITLGAPKEQEVEEGSQASLIPIPKWYNYILMALCPIGISFGHLAMSELRNLDPIIIPLYSYGSILIV